MSKLDTSKSQHCRQVRCKSDAGEILESRNDQVRSETGGVCANGRFQKSVKISLFAKVAKSEISWIFQIPRSPEMSEIWDFWDFWDPGNPTWVMPRPHEKTPLRAQILHPGDRNFMGNGKISRSGSLFSSKSVKILKKSSFRPGFGPFFCYFDPFSDTQGPQILGVPYRPLLNSDSAE